MKSMIILLVSLFLVTGCVTQKRCNCKFPPVQSSVNDSSAVTTTESVQEKDSISYLPADSSWLKMYLECDADNQVIMKQLVSYKNGKNVSVPEVNIKNNTLTAKCKVDSLAVFNHYSKHFKTKIEYRDRKVVETKYINELTAWQRFQTKAFWPETILLMLIGFFVISKIIR